MKGNGGGLRLEKMEEGGEIWEKFVLSTHMLENVLVM